MPKIINPPKRKKDKVYGGSTSRPISIRILKVIQERSKSKVLV